MSHGLRARGSITVDATFCCGRVTACTLTLERDCSICLRCNTQERLPSLHAGERTVLHFDE